MNDSIERTIRTFFTYLENKDITSWIELWENDAHCTFPYGHQLIDQHLEGKDAIRAFWSGSPELYERLHFAIQDIYFKPYAAVVIFTSNHVLRGETGLYKDEHIGVFSFSKGYRIKGYTEYFDSLRLGLTFGMIEVKLLES